MISIVKKVLLANPVAILINHCTLYIILFLGSSILITSIISPADSIQYLNHRHNRKHQPRIIGGDVFTKSPWPFFVALDNDQIFCGGVILDKRIILTSASCVNSTSKSEEEQEYEGVRASKQISIRTGGNSLADTSKEMTIKAVKAVCVSTSFKRKHKMYYNDFALLFLNESLSFANETIEGAGIYPDEKQNETRWYENADCWVVGLSNGAMNITSARINLFDCPDETSNESVFCFKYYYDFAKTCQGDLGDPVVCANNGGFELLGTVSSFVDCDVFDPNSEKEQDTYRVARFQRFYETTLNDCVKWFYEIWENE